MPIVIPQDIPAFSVLKEENIFVMNDERAFSQDIRPLEIAILNLMPTKVETETQFMRLLSNSPLQVNVTLVYTESYKSKNTAAAHLERFYKKFDDIKDKHFDGMIITGAPVETMPFEEVAYWEELTHIFRHIVKSEGCAILFSTHITSDLDRCADDITYIQNGRVLQSADRETFLRSFDHLKTPEDTGPLTLEDIMLRTERSGWDDDAAL